MRINSKTRKCGLLFILFICHLRKHYNIDEMQSLYQKTVLKLEVNRCYLYKMKQFY